MNQPDAAAASVDLRAVHREACDETAAVLATIEPGDLQRPTPCDGWNLRKLVSHMIGLNHGFWAAVRDPNVDMHVFADRPVGIATLVAEWTSSARGLTDAFADAGTESTTTIAPISTELRLPVATVAGFHLVDVTVHTWDVAASVGRPYRPAETLVAASLAVARQIPDGPERHAADAMFAPVARGDDDEWAQTLALVGRDVRWTPLEKNS